MLSDKKVYSRLVLIIFLLALFLSLTGCNKTGGGRIYKPYTVEEGGVHFSLEYPEELNPVVSDFENEFNKYVTFLGLKMDVIEGSITHSKQARISVDIYKQGETVPGVESLIETYIKVNKNLPGSDFRVIKRYTTKVSGIEATVLHSSYSGQYDSGAATVAIDIVVWSIYFEHNGYVWDDEVSYPSEMSAEAEADFEHLLRTFKMLD